MEIFLLYISNDKPMFTGVKQGVYRVETWCLKPMFTWVFTGVKVPLPCPLSLQALPLPLPHFSIHSSLRARGNHCAFTVLFTVLGHLVLLLLLSFHFTNHFLSETNQGET